MSDDFVDKLYKELECLEKQAQAVRALIALRTHSDAPETIVFPVNSQNHLGMGTNKETVMEFIRRAFEENKNEKYSLDELTDRVDIAVRNRKLNIKNQTDRIHLRYRVNHAVSVLKKNDVIGVVRKGHITKYHYNTNQESVVSKKRNSRISSGENLFSETPGEAIMEILKKTSRATYQYEIREILKPKFDNGQLVTATKKLRDLVHYTLVTLVKQGKVVKQGEGTEATYSLIS